VHGSSVVRLAAVSDIHCGKASAGAFQALFAGISESADVLLIGGDLTDYGLPEEARVLAKELTAVRIPVIAVLGNHDIESAQEDEVRRIVIDAGVHLLDGETCEVQGIGFAGVKGFAGGFGRGALGAWGEPMIKQFVHEALAEALKLEAALARLRSPTRVALLHYAPIRETVEGEPVEIFPWLGSSRLEEPLNRYPVSVVFHGHAHNGSPEGKTAGGTPVYNVCLPLLKKHYPDQPPYRIFELAAPAADAEPSPLTAAAR
jgi:Icc-related predicted phosphoesterase